MLRGATFFTSRSTISSEIPLADIQGPVIFALNHSSWTDPMLFAAKLPYSVVKAISPLYFMTGEKFYKKLWLRPLLIISGGLKIKSKGFSVKDFFGDSLKKIEAGGSILIFPEGKIVGNNTKTQAKTGVIYLAQTAQIPIIPVRIKGIRKFSIKTSLTSKAHIKLFIHEPIGIQTSLHGYQQHRLEAQKLIKIIYRKVRHESV